MKKRESKKIQEKELHKDQKNKSHEQNHSNEEQMKHLMDSKQNNMSEGALLVYRIQKSRCHWGNKQLWGSNEKGRNKPGHKTPKTPKK